MSMSETTGRDDSGRFSAGNTYGKGRPRRAVESDYLKALSDALSLDDWRAIVTGSIEAAKAGDAKAREWLSRYALGTQPESLTQLAVDEVLELSSDALIEAHARHEVDKASGVMMFGDVDWRARALRAREREAREAEDEAEREARRLKREAAKALQKAPEASQSLSGVP
jgi:hypothetical protein